MGKNFGQIQTDAHKAGAQLFDRIPSSVLQYFSLSPQGIKILQFLDDAFYLKINNQDFFNRPQGGGDCYYDYSFVIMPAFKALEEWILLIAPSLGVPEDVVVKARSTGHMNMFLAEDKLQEFFNQALDSLEERIGSLQTDKRIHLRDSVSSIYAYLKNFRHGPAHCSTIIEKMPDAETKLHTILSAISAITKTLLEEGIIAVPGPSVR